MLPCALIVVTQHCHVRVTSRDACVPLIMILGPPVIHGEAGDFLYTMALRKYKRSILC
jgi:hypothetical protein